MASGEFEQLDFIHRGAAIMSLGILCCAQDSYRRQVYSQTTTDPNTPSTFGALPAHPIQRIGELEPPFLVDTILTAAMAIRKSISGVRESRLWHWV